jgi:hypothetical protein
MLIEGNLQKCLYTTITLDLRGNVSYHGKTPIAVRRPRLLGL